jgi:hypothetical protein
MTHVLVGHLTFAAWGTPAGWWKLAMYGEEAG